MLELLHFVLTLPILMSSKMILGRYGLVFMLFYIDLANRHFIIETVPHPFLQEP